MQFTSCTCFKSHVDGPEPYRAEYAYCKRGFLNSKGQCDNCPVLKRMAKKVENRLKESRKMLNIDIFRDRKGMLSPMGNLLDQTITTGDKVFMPELLVKRLWAYETELDYLRARVKLLEDQLAGKV